MDFFQAQDAARRRTKWLVGYFLLAVVGVILSSYVLVMVLGNFLGERRPRHQFRLDWSWEGLGMTAVIVGGAILLGSLFKILSLSGGGAVVARDLGGRQVDPETRDPDERRLLNVVEEMAIASGMVRPEVWVLDAEENINAFAAGTEPANAVIAVSRGCLEQLNRNELQGVVAHEFSHILNGDMKMNMRLIGWLFGILMLSIAGRVLLESLRFVRSGRDRNGGGVMIAILAAGVGLMIIGGVGVFFGRLIQAAISRQREFLADAAAVQFTRDPSGIGGALRKIGGTSGGGKLSAAKASEAGHLFFASAGLFSFGFVTHPPLDVRIRAVEPNWDGTFLNPEPQSRAAESRPSRPQPATPPALPALAALAAFGMPELARGTAVHRSLEPEWLAASHSLDDAQTIVFGLLLATSEPARADGLAFLREHVGEAAAVRAADWQAKLAATHSVRKIALLELGIASLRRLPMTAYQSFRESTRWLIASDGQVDLFEFMLQKMIERHLDTAHGLRQPTKIHFRNIRELAPEVNVLTSAMAGLGSDPAAGYLAARHEYLQHTGDELEMLAQDACGLEQIGAAVERCDASTPLVKRQILHLCATAASSDGSLGNREIELLRCIADALACQIPLAATEALALTD